MAILKKGANILSDYRLLVFCRVRICGYLVKHMFFHSAKEIQDAPAKQKSMLIHFVHAGLVEEAFEIIRQLKSEYATYLLA